MRQQRKVHHKSLSPQKGKQKLKIEIKIKPTKEPASESLRTCFEAEFRSLSNLSCLQWANAIQCKPTITNKIRYIDNCKIKIKHGPGQGGSKYTPPLLYALTTDASPARFP